MQAFLGLVLMGVLLLAIWWILSPKKCNICGELSHIWDIDKGGTTCLSCHLQQRIAEINFTKKENLQSNIIHVEMDFGFHKASLLLHPSGSKSTEKHYSTQKRKILEKGLNPGSFLDNTA